jgi:hypothetical protein
MFKYPQSRVTVIGPYGLTSVDQKGAYDDGGTGVEYPKSRSKVEDG